MLKNHLLLSLSSLIHRIYSIPEYLRNIGSRLFEELNIRTVGECVRRVGATSAKFPGLSVAILFDNVPAVTDGNFTVPVTVRQI